MVRAPKANVAGMDPGKADEVVLVLPPEIGREDEQRQRHPAPEPESAEGAAVRGQQHPAQKGGDEESHGVLGHESQADSDADAKPPARVAALKQPHNAPGHRDPPQKVERHVGHERAGEEDGPSDARRKCRHEHSLAAAAHGARHQPGEHSHDSTSDGGEETKAYERGPEKRELDAAQEGSHRRIYDVSPLEVARIGEGEQLVSVESIARACDEMEHGKGEAKKP